MPNTTTKNRSYYVQESAKPWARHRDVASIDKVRPLVSKWLKPGDTWLDVGCGQGTLSSLAAFLNVDYKGIDLVLPSKRDGLLEGEFLDYEFNQQFNFISFFSSLHHFDEWKLAIEKSLSLVKPGGFIFIEQEPNRLWSWVYRQRLKLEPATLRELISVEKHWLEKPSILPEELPNGTTTYHWDYIPFVGGLSLHTNSSIGRWICPHFRKIIRKEAQ